MRRVRHNVLQCCIISCNVFFFKQKTADEMRISDWSSDVCSSDLPNQVGAGAHPYMHLMGIVALGLMWLRMAKAAGAALADGGEDKAFLDAKRVTARYFADRIMPEAGALRRKIEGGSEAMMALPPEMFAAG